MGQCDSRHHHCQVGPSDVPNGRPIESADTTACRVRCPVSFNHVHRPECSMIRMHKPFICVYEHVVITINLSPVLFSYMKIIRVNWSSVISCTLPHGPTLSADNIGCHLSN